MSCENAFWCWYGVTAVFLYWKGHTVRTYYTHTIIIIIVVYHICVWPIPNKEKSGRRRGVNDVRPKTGLSRRGSVVVVGPIDVVIILLLLRTTLRDLENSAPARVFARRQPAGRQATATLRWPCRRNIFFTTRACIFPIFFAPSPPPYFFFSNPIHSFISTHVKCLRIVVLKTWYEIANSI